MGRLRGQRNRDQDRYWHERRKAKQDGMVGAEVWLCVLCGALSSQDAVISHGTDSICKPCASERGLSVPPINVESSRAVTPSHPPVRHLPSQVAAAAVVSRKSAIRRIASTLREQELREAREQILALLDVDNGDRSRRQCAVVRKALYQRRATPVGFATFLSDNHEWPVVDLHGVDLETLAYVPAPMIADYGRLNTRYTLGHMDATWTDSSGPTATLRGGTSRVQAALAVDHFGDHQPWQARIGENAPNVRLREAQVVEIRERYAAGGTSYAKLAKEYGVSYGTISGIVWGDLWIYAPGPVKCRQLLRARCTQSAVYNKYGERTYAERHPAPHMLNAEEAATLGRLEQQREEERYVSKYEIKSWQGKKPVHYEWGVYDPKTDTAELDMDDYAERR